jgi:hypothetical protein
MFNKKLLSGLVYTVGLLLIVKALFVLSMFVWKYFGTQPLVIFDPRFEELSHYVILIQEIGTILFFYVFAGAMKWWLTCMHECKPRLETRMAAAIAPIRRAAVKRPASKKK